MSEDYTMVVDQYSILH